MKRRSGFISVLSVFLAAVMLLASAVPAQAGNNAVGLDHQTLTLYPGDKATIKMIVGMGPADAQGWSTSKKSVATVSKKGVVTAKKAGKAVITCKTGYGYNLTCTVTVKKRVEISSYLNKKYTKLLKKVPEAIRPNSDPIGQNNLYIFPDGGLFLRYDKKTKKISVLQNANSKGLSLYGVTLGMKLKTAKKKLKSAGCKYQKKVKAPTVTDYIYKKSGHQITVKVRSGKVSCVQWAR